MRTKRGHRPYAKNWGKTCYRMRRKSHERCVNCLRRAEMVHHLYYRKGLFRGKIYGREGRLDVAPLCDRCHAHFHQKKFWIKDSDPDDDRNIVPIIWRLRIQFLCVEHWWLPFAAIALFALLLFAPPDPKTIPPPIAPSIQAL